MQMGTFGGAAVSELGDRRPGLHRVAELDPEAAVLQMRVPGEDLWRDFEEWRGR
jgi:hypothetical protein